MQDLETTLPNTELLEKIDNTENNQEESFHTETAETKNLKKQFPIFARAAAIYAVFYAFCLYQNPDGVTYPLFALGLLIYFRYCFQKIGFQRKKSSIFYETSIFLLSISVFLTDSYQLNKITKQGILLLTLVYLLHAVYEDQEWDFVKYFTATFITLFSFIANIFTPFTHATEYAEKNPADETRTYTIKYILIGLAASIPVLFVIIVLLSTADIVFDSYIWDLLNKINIWNMISISCLIICAFFTAYCVLAGLCQKKVKEECPNRRNLEPIPVIIVTGLVTAVYLLFCTIQIVYLFGKVQSIFLTSDITAQGMLPNGYTYAEYARQGFFQLLVVCLLNLGMVLFCTTFFRENRLLKTLLTIICACTYIMLASSAYRMFLYISSYGLTFLRVIVLWALAVIAILMAGTMMHLFSSHFPLFRFGVAVVSVCYIGLAFSHPDYYIAKYNMEQYTKSYFMGEDKNNIRIDLAYISSHLSADAAPILFNPVNYQLLKDCGKSYMESYRFKIEENTAWKSIRKLNLSRFFANRCLTKLLSQSEI